MFRIPAVVLVALLSLSGLEAAADKGGEWRFYSGDNGSTKYSPLDQIDKSNVANLKIAWRRPQVDPGLLKGATVRQFNVRRSFQTP